MAATLKINSVFKNHFDKSDYQINVNNYYDIEFYLRGVHPRFNNYIRQIQTGEANESFALVDSNLRIIGKEQMTLKKVKDGDIIYLVPVVTGAGGKKGFLIAASVVALSFAFPNPFSLPSGFIGPGTAVQEASSFGGAIFQGAAGIFGGLPSFIQGIIGNLALSLITSLFTSKPPGRDQQVTQDSGTRTENNMFGSLVNSTTSGTPVGVNYGLFRLGGQFLSGYVLSAQHDKDNAPTIESYFTPASSPLASDVGTNT